jgi:tyrosyl-tRNA synthetase
VPEDVDEASLAGGNYKLAELLVQTGLAASKGEARRLIEQGGVKIDGEKVAASNADITIGNESILFQVGKRKFLRVNPE